MVGVVDQEGAHLRAAPRLNVGNWRVCTMRLGTCLPHEGYATPAGWTDLDGAVAAVAGAGICGCLTNFPAAPAQWEPHTRALGAALRQHGVALLEYNTPFFLDTGAETDARGVADRVVTLLGLADEVGCANVVTCVAGGRGILPHPDSRAPRRLEVLRRTCDAVAEGAARRGTRARLLIELVYTSPVWSPAVLARCVDAVGSPHVRGHMDLANLLTFDTLFDHAQVARDAFAVCGDRIHSSHVKGVAPLDSYFPGLRECPVTEGVLDMPAYLDCLAAMPADFPVLIEHLARLEDIAASHRHVVAAAAARGLDTWGTAP